MAGSRPVNGLPPADWGRPRLRGEMSPTDRILPPTVHILGSYSAARMGCWCFIRPCVTLHRLGHPWRYQAARKAASTLRDVARAPYMSTEFCQHPERLTAASELASDGVKGKRGLRFAPDSPLRADLVSPRGTQIHAANKHDHSIHSRRTRTR